MPERYCAHTPGVEGGEWQPLAQHLSAVGALAREFAEPLGLGALAAVAGRVHDIGKYSDEFQRYLADSEEARIKKRAKPRRRIDHKVAGSCWAASRLGLLALPILGHHHMLPSKAEAEADPRLQDVDAYRSPFDRAMLDSVLPSESDVVAALQEVAKHGRRALSAEVMLRLVHSCLVDADSLDTEAHFDQSRSRARSGYPSIPELDRQLTAAQRVLIAGAPPSKVNGVRKEVYEDCLACAEASPGVFALTVPTGGGKTRSSLAFALRHAARHGLQRVIYAIPYTSIIEQTAATFRRIFDDERAVLEHHSLVERPEPSESAEYEWAVLASENWAAPIIVTTTVQLLESLFANRPSRTRKVHNVARSVVVLDEVQMLPAHLLGPVLSVLKELVDEYAVSVVLCTATQPALDASPHLAGFERVTEIIQHPARHFEALKRVRFEIDPEPVSWSDVAMRVRTHEQCLVVLNTKKDAVALLQTLDDPAALHLSTRLCAQHRGDTLETIRRLLGSGRPCRVVSTQVVEAGVDLDFPVVFRAMGPLDRIVQAAGRCNREGRLAEGVVTVVDPLEGSRPGGAYRTAISHAAMMLAHSIDFHDPDLFREYFRRLYRDIETDARDIEGLRERMDFPEVARRFKVIHEDTVQVLVPYDADVLSAVCEEARIHGHVGRDLWRQAQRHAVALHRRDFDSAFRDGLLYEVVPGTGLYRWVGAYDPVLGLSSEGADPADLVC